MAVEHQHEQAERGRVRWDAQRKPGKVHFILIVLVLYLKLQFQSAFGGADEDTSGGGHTYAPRKTCGKEPISI